MNKTRQVVWPTPFLSAFKVLVLRYTKSYELLYSPID